MSMVGHYLLLVRGGGGGGHFPGGSFLDKVTLPGSHFNRFPESSTAEYK